MVPDKRPFYEQRAMVRLWEWEADINRLGKRFAAAKASAKAKLVSEFEAVRKKHVAIEQKLQKLKDAGEERWKHLRDRVEGAWVELQTSFDYLKNRFKQPR